VVLQVEAPVHVVDAVGDLVGVRHHPQVEWFGIGDDGLSDSIHTQIVPTEPVSAVVCLFVLAMAPRYEEVVSNTSFPVIGSLHRGVLGVVVEVRAVGEGEGARLQLLVELSPTEAVLLLYAGGIVQVVKLPGVTCYKFTALQVVRVADVVVAEAADAVVVEGLEAATDTAVVLETAVRCLLHLTTTATGNLSHLQLPGSSCGEMPGGEIVSRPPVDINCRVAESSHQTVRLGVENIELVRAVVELLLQGVQEEGEVRGSSALSVEIDVVASVLPTEQRILSVSRNIKHVKVAVAKQRRLNVELSKVHSDLANTIQLARILSPTAVVNGQRAGKIVRS